MSDRSAQLVLPISANPGATWSHWVSREVTGQVESFARALLDQGGTGFFLWASEGQGKSHFLQACCAAKPSARYLPMESLLEYPPEAILEHAENDTMVVVDDIHLIAEHEQYVQSIGHLIDHALNLGAHVLSTSTSHPREWKSSRLWELLRHASVSTIHRVSEASLAMHIKQQASLLGMLFDDAHTMEILNHSGQSWRGVEAALSTLKDAYGRGQEILNPEDVIAVLNDQSVEASAMEETSADSPIALASDILKRATDVVYSEVDVGGIELHTSALEEEEDDWGDDDW